ncbi:RHS repeat domain-containing protein [Microbacterium sp. NPDC087665]|uniref:RHS repeat domain-containing protein n=1 Tax=Microbacterium sp. NPDC087665 TaxID=3364194 RepID=UPI003827C739
MTAQFNAAGQLTGTTTTGANAGSASYSFDGAGNRSSQTVNGQSTSFGHDAAGRLLSTQADGRSTSYAYDGLDRRASVTDETRFGSDTTGTVWDGFDPVATDSGLHGVTDLLRDPLGGVVFQDGAYENEWVLGDMRNATATADAGGQITDLVDYADFGGADYESTGWGSLVGNDGQPGDATLGLDHYYARDYDTVTGTWVQPDEWRGLLVRPQSLNRFAYVENSPVAFSDYLGYLPIGGGLKGGVAKANAKSAMKKGGIAAAVAKTNASVPPHSFGKGAPSGAVKPRDRVITPQNRSPFFTAQLHLLNLRGCGFGDIACRGTRLASTSSCFLMPNPASCLFSEMDRSVRPGIESTLSWIRNAVRVTGEAIGNAATWLGARAASATRGYINSTATWVGLTYALNTGAVCVPIGDGIVACGRRPGGGIGPFGSGWGAQPGGAITIGNVIYGGFELDEMLADEDLMRHEINHTWQWARGGGGLGFLIPWALNGAASACNPYEREAGLEGTNYELYQGECK